MKRNTFFFIIFSLCTVLIFNSKSLEAKEGAYAVSVNNGLISIDAESASLETVLKELSKETGVNFADRTSSIPTDIISISFKNLPLSEAIARVLKNYSFIIEEGSNPSVIILASLPSREVPVKQSSTAKVYTAEPERRVSREAKQVTYFQTTEKPFDLDECQPLEFTEEDANQNISLLQESLNEQGTKGGHTGPVAEKENQYLNEKMEENQKKLEDAKIKRAQKVLGMERCSNLWEQAIDELSRIQDDRVISILKDTASSGKTKKLREKAAQAVWHNTADSQFKNTKGIDALKGLSSSSDPDVSRIANQALKDYERYTSKNN